MRDILQFAATVGFGTLMMLGSLWLLLNTLDEAECNEYSEITGKATMYKSLSGCYIETVDGWQNWDEYKYHYVAKDGLTE